MHSGVVSATAWWLECVITLWCECVSNYYFSSYPPFSYVFTMVNCRQNILMLGGEGDEEYVHPGIIVIKLHLLLWDPAWQRGPDAGRYNYMIHRWFHSGCELPATAKLESMTPTRMRSLNEMYSGRGTICLVRSGWLFLPPLPAMGRCHSFCGRFTCERLRGLGVSFGQRYVMHLNQLLLFSIFT